MKKLLCGLLCLLMLLGCASAEGYWYAAKGDNGLWGHIDEMGNWVIPPKFDSAGDFRGNYAWIQQGDREGFANRDGEIVLLLDENVVTDSGYDGFCYGGRETGIWLLYKKATGKNSLGTEWLEGFFDVQSGVYSGLKWRGVNHRESNSRLIAVADETGKWGYASRDTGELVIPYRYGAYDRGANFCEGYAAVYTEDENYVIQECYLLNEAGEETPLPDGMQFANIYDPCVSEGLIAVEDENGRVGYCNTACEVVIAPQFAEAEDFSGGYAAVKFSEEEWGIIDHAGNVLMRTSAPYDRHTQNGYYVLPAENGGLTMCHVEQGELFTLQVPNLAEFWRPEKNGLCIYQTNTKDDYRCGVVNMQGEIISEAKWWLPEKLPMDDHYFSGVLLVQDPETGLYNYINERGELLTTLPISYAVDFVGALAYVVVEQDDGTTQYGYINQQGEWVYSWTE